MMKRMTVEYEDELFTIRCRDQTMTVPRSLMARFISAVEMAYSRQRRATQGKCAQERTEPVRQAQAKIQDAKHPDILPFTNENKNI